MSEKEYIVVQRAYLEKEHRLLIARLHELREVLGYPPLKTGKKQREAQRTQ